MISSTYEHSTARLEAINDALYGGFSRIKQSDLFDHDFQLMKSINLSYSTRYEGDEEDEEEDEDDDSDEEEDDDYSDSDDEIDDESG